MTGLQKLLVTAILVVAALTVLCYFMSIETINAWKDWS